MQPASAAERAPASARGSTYLIPTRVARQKTLDYRRNLLDDFRVWLFSQHGVMLQTLLPAKPPDADEFRKVAHDVWPGDVFGRESIRKIC